MFNAPLIVIVMALLLVALYAAYSFASLEQQVRALYDYALVPRRFWAEAGDSAAYPNILAKVLTLLSTSLLHGDWMHVILNAGMLLAFGTPVARATGPGITGAGKWMLIYISAVIIGSIAYLGLNGAGAGAAVGASGGTSGLMAAAMLAGPYGTVRSPLSRQFLTFTAMFVVANIVLAYLGPAALGMGIAWEAHAGGYAAGAIMMLLLGRRVDFLSSER